MKYENFKRDYVGSVICNEKLPGAISTKEEFGFFSVMHDDIGKELIPDGYEVIDCVPKNIICDLENEFFIGEYGAIAGAFEIKGLWSEEDKEKIFQTIIEEKQKLYPDYQFVVMPGRFPIDVCDKEYGDMSKNNVHLSTHILYITDYERHFQKLILKTLS